MIQAKTFLPPALTAVLVLALAAPSWAGAWLQEPGTAYLRLSGGIMVTDTRFDSAGNEIPFDNSGGGFRDVDYRDLAFTAYAEWGLHRDWVLITDATWKRLRADQPSALFTTYGFGDIGLGIKRSLYRGSRTVAAVVVYGSFPTGYEPEEYPSLGSDVTDLAARLEVGTSTASYWVNGEAGYVLRGGDFRNQIKAAASGGFNLSSLFAVRGDVRGGVPVGEEAVAGGEFRFDPSAVDPGNLDVAGTVSYRVVRGLAVEGELRSTVWGENTLKGTRFSLALASSPAIRLRGRRSEP